VTDTRLLTAVLNSLDGAALDPAAFPALLSAVGLVAEVLSIGRNDRLTEQGCGDYHGRRMLRALDDAAKDAKKLRDLKPAVS
jgi:hypothetical protein